MWKNAIYSCYNSIGDMLMEIIAKRSGKLLEYLEENLDMPKKKIKDYLHFKSIYVDGVLTTKYDYEVHEGSKIVIDTKKKTRYVLPFNIIYEDSDIIVVSKPSGILTISDGKEDENTVYHLVSKYLKSKNHLAKVFVVHRLDKLTSGVLLLAKSEKIKDMYQEDWNKYSKREYVAVVHGIPSRKEDRLVNKISETKTHLSYISKDGKEAVTNYKVIESTKNYSKLEIEIETGRKNQIRLQLKNIGNPIVGDQKYGINDGYKRLYLHAYKLCVYNKKEKKYHTYISKVPGEFNYLLKKDRCK